MGKDQGITRRGFLRGATACGAWASLGGLALTKLACGPEEESRFSQEQTTETLTRVFRVEQCPVPDGELRHVGVDTLLDLLSENGVRLFRTGAANAWGSPGGIIGPADVVLIKVNCQWKCRGTTNTDVLKGLIHRILQHPDGFRGEVVVIENGQGQGSFSGRPLAWGSYLPWPDIHKGVFVNAEEEDLLTVEYLVNEVFAGQPVSCYLLDPIRASFLAEGDHSRDGYRRLADVSYPCFTTAAGNRVELRDGIWNGSGHDANLKLINLPVLKTHAGTGITASLKHMYGVLSMADGQMAVRHYAAAGTQCGKMFGLVRAPDLNILDCIWVSHESLSGYPPETTRRTDTLLAGIDPVALDHHACTQVLLPLGGREAHMHDPDSFPGLRNHLVGARDFINENGGIGGRPCRMADEDIEVVVRAAVQES